MTEKSNKDLKQDVVRLQELIGSAFTRTGSLVAYADGGAMSSEKLQKTLEQTADEFERATLDLRRLCERSSPGVGGFARRTMVSPTEVIGSVETFGLGNSWLHMRLNTLLPHCRYQTPGWLSDTIRRLLDDYEAAGNELPQFERAMLVIDEHSDIDGRHIYDSDNKGWKAVSNAIKGRLIPDDDQYTLSIALLSRRSTENVCHIALLDLRDASDFFAGHSGYYAAGDIYNGRWP
ncbi:MAG: hypothetical protein K6G54_00480 [Oscillospiraceae bacterium]|nr:hypothetical protein [Oscillospiraceae bacterium]